MQGHSLYSISRLNFKTGVSNVSITRMEIAVPVQFFCFCSALSFAKGSNWWILNVKFSAFSRRLADVICHYSLFPALYWVCYTTKNGRSIFVLTSGQYCKNGCISGTTVVSREDVIVRSNGNHKVKQIHPLLSFLILNYSQLWHLLSQRQCLCAVVSQINTNCLTCFWPFFN